MLHIILKQAYLSKQNCAAPHTEKLSTELLLLYLLRERQKLIVYIAH